MCSDALPADLRLRCIDIVLERVRDGAKLRDCNQGDQHEPGIDATFVSEPAHHFYTSI
jgi:hypothetical protein